MPPLREGQSALAALQSGDLGHGPERESLEDFLSKLPQMWRDGEVRPTYRQELLQPRGYRTRQDPFENVWPEILGWLQAEPDATAKALMERLQKQFPDQFPDGQLRTLQRRIGEWRKMMARTLVHGLNGDETTSIPEVIAPSDNPKPKAPIEAS